MIKGEAWFDKRGCGNSFDVISIFTKIFAMRFAFLLTMFGLFLMPGHGQERYKDEVFTKVNRERNIYYGPDAPRVKRNMLDLYTPKNDTALNRPLIILFHGGGFKFGSKNNSRMRVWGKQFAKKGYVCAAVNYRKRKGKPLQHFPDLALACLTAVEDALTATKYLKQHAAQFGIDQSKIVLAGHSAGGMIALQAVYSNPGDIYSLVQKQGPAEERPDAEKHNPAGIAAIINFWGAIFDTTWLQHASVPIVSVHGSRDRIVPFNFTDNNLFGSAAIQRNASRAGTPTALKVYDGYGHELQKHFNPLYAGSRAKKRWREAGTFAAGFLFEQFWPGNVGSQ